MEQSTEARWLLNNWNRDILGRYQNQWIAVLGENVIGNAETFSLLKQRISDYRPNEFNIVPVNPLYAFVYFGRLQV